MSFFGKNSKKVPQYDHIHKIIIIGESNVGKSCLLLQFTDKKYLPDHVPTIGVEFGTKIVNIKNDKKAKLQIWDTAGIKSFRSIALSHYRGAHAALVMFDLTQRTAFEKLKKYDGNIDNQCSKHAIKILVVNKCDLEKKRECSDDEIIKYAKNNGYQQIFFASAMNNKVLRIVALDQNKVKKDETLSKKIPIDKIFEDTAQLIKPELFNNDEFQLDEDSQSESEDNIDNDEVNNDEVDNDDFDYAAVKQKLIELSKNYINKIEGFTNDSPFTKEIKKYGSKDIVKINFAQEFKKNPLAPTKAADRELNYLLMCRAALRLEHPELYADLKNIKSDRELIAAVFDNINGQRRQVLKMRNKELQDEQKPRLRTWGLAGINSDDVNKIVRYAKDSVADDSASFTPRWSR